MPYTDDYLKDFSGLGQEDQAAILGQMKDPDIAALDQTLTAYKSRQSPPNRAQLDMTGTPVNRYNPPNRAMLDMTGTPQPPELKQGHPIHDFLLNQWEGLKAGGKLAGYGTLQAMANMDNPDVYIPHTQKETDEMNADFAKKYNELKSHGSGLGRFIGETAVTAPIAAALAPEAAGAGLGTRILGNMAGNAGATYLTSPGTPGEKAVNATAAAAVTPVFQGATEGLVNPALSAIGRGAGWVESKLPRAMENLVNLAKNKGVDLHVENLDPRFVGAAKWANETPLSGMPAKNAELTSQVETMAKNFITGLKNKVYGANTTQGAGPDLLVQASARSNAAADNAVGHEIYQAGAELAGEREIPRDLVIKEMKSIINEEGRKNSPDTNIINDMNYRIKRLTQTPFEAARSKDNLPPMDRTYMGMHELASEFAGKANSFQKGTPEYRTYMRLANAARDNMQRFADESGDEALKSITNLGNEWWKTKVKDYSPDSRDYSSWAKSLSGKELDPEAISDNFNNAKTDGKARYFYNGLDDNGRAAARWGMARDAYSAATGGKNGMPGDEPFNIAAFRGALKNNQVATRVFFRDQDAKELNGIMKILQVTSGTGKAALTPGISSGKVGMGIGQGLGMLGTVPEVLLGHPGVAAATAGVAAMPSVAARVIKTAMTTDAGRKMLLAASNYSPTSKALYGIAQKIMPELTGAAAGTAMSGITNSGSGPITDQFSMGAPK
jgi:hypothetical protein